MNSKRDARAPLRRRDAGGHIDRAYAKQLLALSGRSDGDERGLAFLEQHDDDLAEVLGEAFLEGATSGERADLDALGSTPALEDWGPFLLIDTQREAARGTEGSNPSDATSEYDATREYDATNEPLSRVVGAEDAC